MLPLKVSNYRRGEEHSFILKPATSLLKNIKIQGERSPQSSKLQFRNSASKLSLDEKKIASNEDQYAVMVSCRCNYTGSFLFLTPFKLMLFDEC